MESSLGKIPAQMLASKCPSAGQKVTLVSLDPSKSGLKVQMPSQHRAPQPGISSMSVPSPGVTLTVSPSGAQLGAKSRPVPAGQGSRPAVQDSKTKTVILTSPCIKWIKSGPNLKVINLPVGLVPSLNICRVPSAKSVVISRPANLNQIIIHKEAPLPRRTESLPHSPALSAPWRGQVTPIVFSAAPSPVVLSISQSAEAGNSGAGLGLREPGTSLPINSGYSRGVYENFRKWQEYKGLVRKHFPMTPDTEAVACFFIPVLRSLSQFKPQLSTEEGIPLAIQEWGKLSNFDRMIYYEMAEKFIEFEVEEHAQRLQCEQVPAQPGISQGLPILSRVSGKPSKQVMEDLVGKKCSSKVGSQRSNKQAKATPQAGHGPGPHHQPPIPPEAITQYIEIMEALNQDQQPEGQGEGEAIAQPFEDRVSEEPELIKYIEKLCSKDSFISKAEAIIHPEFLSNLLSPQGHMDFPRLMKQLEMEENLSAGELDGRRDSPEAAVQDPAELPDPCPPPAAPEPLPQAPSHSPAPSEAPQALQGLRPPSPPPGGECPCSSRLQRLALQSACDKAPAPEPAAPAPQDRTPLLGELGAEGGPRGAPPAGGGARGEGAVAGGGEEVEGEAAPQARAWSGLVPPPAGEASTQARAWSGLVPPPAGEASTQARAWSGLVPAPAGEASTEAQAWTVGPLPPPASEASTQAQAWTVGPLPPPASEASTQAQAWTVGPLPPPASEASTQAQAWTGSPLPPPAGEASTQARAWSGLVPPPEGEVSTRARRPPLGAGDVPRGRREAGENKAGGLGTPAHTPRPLRRTNQPPANARPPSAHPYSRARTRQQKRSSRGSTAGVRRSKRVKKN
ncbi:NUT family member 2G-like [Carcharodon carcharias]|uniref:NUT family member 2G-like n=1 Tax=Carcharodon carcharias TaxID=13397 RepID=UPI001B7F3558|nr:NUT family member 2G-like [Carcharodon carcharias]